MVNDAINVGTAKHTKEGTTKCVIRPTVDTRSPIHSIVVVTSPIGDQAPPALAAITPIQTNQRRSILSGTNRLKSETNTIVEAKLSRVADKKNASIQTNQSIFFLLFVVILLVITENPLCKSINSTIVMAPIRNTNISAVLPIWCSRTTPKKS